MIHFLTLTPIFFGNPKCPLPNFSLRELQPDDVRQNIRCHWSSQTGTGTRSLQLPHPMGSRVGLGDVTVISQAVLRLGVMGTFLIQEMPSLFSVHLSAGLGKVFPEGRGSFHCISKFFPECSVHVKNLLYV